MNDDEKRKLRTEVEALIDALWAKIDTGELSVGEACTGTMAIWNELGDDVYDELYRTTEEDLKIAFVSERAWPRCATI